MHLMLSLSISYPYLIEFHDFVDNIQEGMKHQMGGATHAQQGMTFQIHLIFIFYHENGTLLKMWEPVRFSNWLPGENRCQFSANGWEPPNTGWENWTTGTASQIWFLAKKKTPQFQWVLHPHQVIITIESLDFPSSTTPQK
jgi:hypothetical protein